MNHEANMLRALLTAYNESTGFKVPGHKLDKAISELTLPTSAEPYVLVPFENLLARSMQELDATNAEECVSTGYQWLDDKIVGLFKGELLVLGGESGTGKTQFATGICYKASERRIKTTILALEDRMEDYGIKAVYFEIGRLRKKQGLHNYPWNAYRKNEIRDQNYKTLRDEAVKKIQSSNLNFVEVKKQMDIDLLEKIIHEETANGTKLFLIDHLHYLDMTAKDNASRAEWVERMMIRIKSVMNVSGARVILVVHYKKLEGKKPLLDSFKDSIAIPQNANYVLNMWRDRSEKGAQYETHFYLPKVRNPNGEATVKLTYDPDENEYKDEVSDFGTPQEDSAQSLADNITL